MPTNTDHAQLKALLLEDEQRRIDALEARLDDTNAQLQSMANMLPEALNKADPERLSKSLANPVGKALGSAIQRDPQPVADALFPIIGPAIRKSIAEALKGFTDSINHMIEVSLSPKSIGWRLQAMRSGTPFAQIVLKNTLMYRVSRALLINRQTGLMMGHAEDDSTQNDTDSDAVSAMLTVVQDFVHDAFSNNSNDELATVDMGEYALWVLRGPSAMLAVIVHGVAPPDLRVHLQEVLESLHQQYGEELADFDGDRSALPDIHTSLKQCLQSERHKATKPNDKLRNKQSENKPKRRKWPWVLAALLVVAWITFYCYQVTQQEAAKTQDMQAWLNDVEAEAGIIIVRQKKSGHVHLLVDPLAPDVRDSKPDWVQLETSAFYSLEPSLVLRRARAQLKAPDSVHLRLQQNKLIVSGHADFAWRNKMTNMLIMTPGFDAIDLQNLKTTPP